MEKFVPVVVIKELSETDKILTALKGIGINTAEITFRTACAAEAIEYACKNYPEMAIGAVRFVFTTANIRLFSRPIPPISIGTAFLKEQTGSTLLELPQLLAKTLLKSASRLVLPLKSAELRFPAT